MADKPSRGLVLYGDGLARSLNASARTGHLSSLASRSCCGFLSLPNAPTCESEDERIVREFAVLLDACDHNAGDLSSTPSLADRFMGMKTAVITTHSGIESLCRDQSISIFRLDRLVALESSHDDVPRELLKLLGFEGDRPLESSPFDLVFLHIGAGQQESATNVEYLNYLVGSVMKIASPGSAIASRLHLSVAISYGPMKQDDSSRFSIQMLKNEINPIFGSFIPHQSYTMRGETVRENVRHYCPMLLAQLQDGVTRVDMAETFSFHEFKQNGGNLVIPADRFLHEVSFKLWKAPKYGA